MAIEHRGLMLHGLSVSKFVCGGFGNGEIEKIFKAKTIPLSHKLIWIAKQGAEIRNAFTTHAEVVNHNTGLSSTSVSWVKPNTGWTKLNVDGSVSHGIGSAGCGGVLRDSKGDWITGFTHNIGVCSIGEAEAWGILQGLRMAAWKGVTNLIIESDSKSAIDQLQGLPPPWGNTTTSSIYVLLKWQVFAMPFSLMFIESRIDSRTPWPNELE